MGNQPPESITVHTFKLASNSKFLTLRWDNVAHQARLQGVFSTWIITDKGLDAMFPTVTLQFLGLDETDQNRYLAVTSNSNFTAANSEHPGALWRMTTIDQTKNVVTLRSLSANAYIRSTTNGEFRLSTELSEHCYFILSSESMPLRKIQNMRAISRKITQIIPLKERFDFPPSTLQPEQIKLYQQEGYMICRNLLSAEQISAAQQLIQRGIDLGADQNTALFGIIKQHWPKEFRKAPEILELISHSSILRNGEALVGHPLLVPDDSQIALRRPKPNGDKDFGLAFDWHIDAYDKFTAARFAVLVLVALSDWDADNMGNFTVFKGSHHTVSKMLETLSWNEWNKAVKNSVELNCERVQLHARCGDVIFAHPLLAHDVAPNTSDSVRWAALYRLMFADRSNRTDLLHPGAENRELND